jgi:hypothetical protein
MWMTQVKAFTLLFFVLLIVDALAFQGEYRARAAHQVSAFFGKVNPAHWNGLGEGRDWAQPGRPGKGG